MQKHRNCLKHKILIILTVVILIFNIVLPVKSHAFSWGSLGGTLWKPVEGIVLGLGDAIYTYILQPAFVEGAPDAVFACNLAELKGDTGLVAKLDEFATHIPFVAKGTAFLANLFGSDHYENDGEEGTTADEVKNYYKTKLVFPSIYYSVENIFANKIPAFDVNFINPSINPPRVIPNGIDMEAQVDASRYVSNVSSQTYTENRDGTTIRTLDENQQILEDKLNDIISSIESDTNATATQKQWAQSTKNALNENQGRGKIGGEDENGVKWYSKDYTGIVQSAGEAGVNVSSLAESSNETSEKAIGNIAKKLSGIISKWYNSLRDLALVVMLTVLVYVAIRIIISSTADGAKYKTMLKDWLMAIVLLFLMHYIMSFALYLTQALTNMLYNAYANALNSSVSTNEIAAQTLATGVRMKVSLAEDLGQAMAYTITYALLVIYTIIFTWQYMKRTIYMAFLTVISPLVAITYPIDKVGDGQAQAFNMWLREYIFNLLLQPVHLLLFTILAVSAIDLFETNVVYSLVILGFLLQSIKIFKQFFGFDRAPTGESFTSGFAGGALFSSALGTLEKIPSVGGGSGSSTDSGSSAKANSINFADGSNRGADLKNLKGFTNTNNVVSGGNISGTVPSFNVVNSNASNVGNSNSGVGAGTGAGAVPIAVPSTSYGQNNNYGVHPTTNAQSGLMARLRRKASRSVPVRTIKGFAQTGKTYIPKGAKTITKIALSGIGAATAGTIGVAAGLASDNYGDVFKYGAMGVTGGKALGKKAYNTGAGVASGTKNVIIGTKDSFQQGFYGDDYEAVIADKQWNKSKDVEKHLREKFQGDWKQVKNMQMELRQRGITDQGDLDVATKLMKSNNNRLNVDEAASLMKFKKDISRGELMKEETRKNVEEQVIKLVGTGQKDRVMQALGDVFDVYIPPSSTETTNQVQHNASVKSKEHSKDVYVPQSYNQKTNQVQHDASVKSEDHSGNIYIPTSFNESSDQVQDEELMDSIDDSEQDDQEE